MAKYFAEIGPDGTIILRDGGKDVGDKLDLRTEQIAHGFPAPPQGRTK
jgi:hypothetical protein